MHLRLVPGHALVGWPAVRKDGNSGEPLFVETTVVGVATLEQAVLHPAGRVSQERRAGTFKSGASTLIDVATLREQGFTARPV